MAFKGLVEARCPKGCEPFEIEVWSFVRGDVDSALRESLLAGELNLVVCEECDLTFFPEVALVYYDPDEELLAFVFPESYRKEEERWRRKMHEDYEKMRELLAIDVRLGRGRRKKASSIIEPVLYFGMAEVSRVIQVEQDLGDEARIAVILAPSLGLSLYPVDRSFARRHALPKVLPFLAKGRGRKFSSDGAIRGLKVLLKSNDRLRGFRRWRDRLSGSEETPPPARGGRIAHPNVQPSAPAKKPPRRRVSQKKP